VTNSLKSIASDTILPVYLTPSRAGRECPEPEGREPPTELWAMRSMGGDGFSTTQGRNYRALASPSFSHNSAAGALRCFGPFFTPRCGAPDLNSRGGRLLCCCRAAARQLAAPLVGCPATFSPRLGVRGERSAAPGTPWSGGSAGRQKRTERPRTARTRRPGRRLLQGSNGPDSLANWKRSGFKSARRD
jgi:hypothetical protein